MFKLHVYSQTGDFDQQIEIEGDTAIIGRSSECNIVIDRKDISRRHARLLRGWVIDDLGSRNGTHVHGAKIEVATLVRSQRFEVGDPGSHNLVTIEVLSSDQPSGQAQAARDPDVTELAADDAPIGERVIPAVPCEPQDSGVALLRARFEAETARYREKCAKLEGELEQLRNLLDSFQSRGPDPRAGEERKGDTVRITPRDVRPKPDGEGP